MGYFQPPKAPLVNYEHQSLLLPNLILLFLFFFWKLLVLFPHNSKMSSQQKSQPTPLSSRSVGTTHQDNQEFPEWITTDPQTTPTLDATLPDKFNIILELTQRAESGHWARTEEIWRVFDIVYRALYFKTKSSITSGKSRIEKDYWNSRYKWPMMTMKRNTGRPRT